VRDYVSGLNVSQIASSLEAWVGHERETTAVIVAHLMVMERERIHIDMGYPSLYRYCTERLGYSPDCALKRIRATRAAIAMPELLDDLQSGKIKLSSVMVLARHLEGGQEAEELLEARKRRRKGPCRARPAQDREQARSRAGDGGPGLFRRRGQGAGPACPRVQHS